MDRAGATKARLAWAAFVVGILVTTGKANAQSKDRAEVLAALLAQRGYDNVAVTRRGPDLSATFENNVVRYEIRASWEALDLLTAEAESSAVVTVVQQRLSIPIVTVTVNAGSYRAFRRGELRAEELMKYLHVSFNTHDRSLELQGPKLHSSFWRFDVIAHPQLRAQFGDFNEPVHSQVNITPEVSTSLWPGMRIAAQLIIPLQNELEEGGDYVRPGLLTVSQAVRLPGTTFINATVGYFTHDRYGIDFETRKFFRDGSWALGANVGLTGLATRVDEGWMYETPDLLTFFAIGEYWLATFDVRLRATIGRFVFEDFGARIDVLRRFGELDIGFFALDTERGANGGISFSVPLLPRRAATAGRIRVRPARDFRWEYRYQGLPTAGIQYRTGAGIDEFLGRLRPAYVRSAFNRLSQ